MTTNTSDKLRKLAYSFIMQNRAAALATVDEAGNPHVAIVYCVVHHDLSLYFSSRVESRKYANLLAHPTIAMTFMNETEMKTIQLTGQAKQINGLKDEQEVLYELLTSRHSKPDWPIPSIKMFEQGATNELAIIKVIPTEMTLADFAITKSGRYKPFFQKVI